MRKYLVVMLFAIALVGCSTNKSLVYTNFVEFSAFTQVKTSRSIELKDPVYAFKQSTSWAELDTDEGLLPGRYVSALENESGTLYFGVGRPNFLRADKGLCYLRPGGIWVPKASSESIKIFLVVDSEGLVKVKDLDTAISKHKEESMDSSNVLPLAAFATSVSTSPAGSAASVGVVSALAGRDDGKISIYTPFNDQAFSEKISSIVKAQLEGQLSDSNEH